MNNVILNNIISKGKNVIRKKQIAELEAILDSEAPVNDYLGVIRANPGDEVFSWYDGQDVTLDGLKEELEGYLDWIETEFDYSQIADTEQEQEALQEKDVAMAEDALDWFNNLVRDLNIRVAELERRIRASGKGE